MIYKITRKNKLVFQRLKFDVFLILYPILKEYLTHTKSERLLLRFSLNIQKFSHKLSINFRNMFSFYNSTPQNRKSLNKFRNVFHIESDGFVIFIVRFADCDNHDRHIPFRVESELLSDYILLEAAYHICIVAVRPCDKL